MSLAILTCFELDTCVNLIVQDVVGTSGFVEHINPSQQPKVKGNSVVFSQDVSYFSGWLVLIY